MTNSKPLISIIIPTFNEEKNIKKCIDSLLEHSYPNQEIIVVDDGSKDSTVELLKNLSVKLLTQQHLGPAKARNKAAGEAKGDILVFVDADMTFDKDFITDLVTPIIEEKYRGTFSKEEYISNWENVWSRCWNYNQNWPNKKMIPEDYPDEGMDFRAILKAEFLKINGFDDTGYTDTWTLARKLGYKPHSVKGARYYHSNPNNLNEVFVQSKWVSKRNYKFGMIGIVFALVRTLLPISLIIGITKSIKYGEFRFVVFKIIYDLGAFLGVLQMLIWGKLSK